MHTLGILIQSQPKGLVVPDASLFPVKAPSDVIKLMDIGLKNRSIGATAMNERSSRSHSVVSIHVCGKDLKTGSTMVGNLHLVSSLKNTILAKEEEIERLKLPKGSVGSIAKRSKIPRSRSIKHFEADNQQPMDDHIHQNEFEHIGKNIAESSGCTDSDFDGRSSDLSDSGVAPGTETDGSENSSLTEGTKSSETRSKGIRKTVQVIRKLGRTSSITTTTVKDPLKKSPDNFEIIIISMSNREHLQKRAPTKIIHKTNLQNSKDFSSISSKLQLQREDLSIRHITIVRLYEPNKAVAPFYPAMSSFIDQKEKPQKYPPHHKFYITHTQSN
ncbi:hypothetical protein VNO78_10092 [Psophocarpus tetragonolobus]|uniref:Kinesin motor domain-containing protein n=1 Tax=Psophocarpus tetragonolobus TaxID=3891 RepID=A0AAN9XLY6_PSOTE